MVRRAGRTFGHRRPGRIPVEPRFTGSARGSRRGRCARAGRYRSIGGQPGFGKEHRPGIEQIGDVEEHFAVARFPDRDLRGQVEIDVERPLDAIVVIGGELRGRERAIGLALDPADIVASRAYPTPDRGDREQRGVIGRVDAVDPFRRASLGAVHPDAVERHGAGDPLIDDIVDIARRDPAQREAFALADRHAIRSVYIDPAHQLAGEIERLRAEQQIGRARLRQRRWRDRISGAIFLPPVEAAIDDLLRAERPDRILHLDAEIIDRDAEARHEARREDRADIQRIGLFGLEVEVADDGRRIGIARRPLR